VCVLSTASISPDKPRNVHSFYITDKGISTRTIWQVEQKGGEEFYHISTVKKNKT
jgi:hypothetical protein